MKKHLKRLPAPSAWVIDRKKNIFIVRPRPGPHSFALGISLGVILRDMLQLANTMGEVRKLLNHIEVTVDGKRQKDHRFVVGLFDVLSIPSSQKTYRIILDKKGRVSVHEISSAESSLKLCKIIGKRVISGGKTQLNLHDGKNVLTNVPAKVSDTLVLEIPSLKVQKVLPLQSGMTVFFMKGKHSGDTGQLKEVSTEEVTYIVDGKEIKTRKAYAFVIGEKKPLIGVHHDSGKSSTSN